MRLSGQQRKKLQSALIDAFRDKASLEQMLSFELDKNLEEIAFGSNLLDIVFKLIQKAESQGWVEDLVHAARKSNPGNPKLKTIPQELLSLSASSLDKLDNKFLEQERKLENPNHQQLHQQEYDNFQKEASSTSASLKEVTIFVSETNTDTEPELLISSCIITREPELLRRKLEEVKNDILCDLVFKNIPNIQSQLDLGFHFFEDYPNVKSKIIDSIRRLPFEAYICYQTIDSNDDLNIRHHLCNCLFNKLIYQRLQANKNAIVKIHFKQENCQFERPRQEIEKIVSLMVQKMEVCDGIKFKVYPEVVSANKEEICLSITDCIAAIFRNYEAKEIGNPTSWQARDFKRILPKIRIIHDYMRGKPSTRHELRSL